VLANLFRKAPDPETVLQDYGIVLGRGAPEPGYVADTSALPHSKLRIKKALVVALRSMQDPHMRSQLKKAYVSLADWQDGVGATRPGGELLSRVQAEKARLQGELKQLDL
jgi:hypothetical protein